MLLRIPNHSDLMISVCLVWGVVDYREHLRFFFWNLKETQIIRGGAKTSTSISCFDSSQPTKSSVTWLPYTLHPHLPPPPRVWLLNRQTTGASATLECASLWHCCNNSLEVSPPRNQHNQLILSWRPLSNSFSSLRSTKYKCPSDFLHPLSWKVVSICWCSLELWFWKKVV